MTDTEIAQCAAQDAFLRGALDIPDDAKLLQMSFVELAALLSSCESGSAKFNVVEREMKRRLTQDQAKINRPNMLWAAGIGGTFALSGVVLGAWLNNAPAFKKEAPSATVQQVSKSNLSEKPSITQIAPIGKSATGGTDKPDPVNGNAQPSKQHP